MPLILAGVPIGRPDDASDRLRGALATADVVAAEDTRRLARLCKDLGVEVAGRVVSYFEANETERTPRLLESLRAGETVLLVTDAGMPSDLRVCPPDGGRPARFTRYVPWRRGQDPVTFS